MKRNITNAAQDGKKLARKRPALDMSASDIKSLIDLFNNTAADKGTTEAAYIAIAQAYYSGLAIGNRNA